MTAPLIIGGGLAGLFAALKLAPLPCTILTPAPLGEGASSAWAQGGIAAAIGVGDSLAAHVADTLIAGAGLCVEARVAGMVAEANARIADLLHYGVPFDRDIAGQLVQSREAAHSAARIVRVKGDRAGAAIMSALVAAVRQTPSITVIEGAEARDILVEDGRVTGLRATLAGRQMRFAASHILLATGGCGQLFAVTTNPKEAWGSGLGMAYRAGATIENAEFVQFHPTAIAIGRDPAPLATEALRGEGATLVDSRGHRFMVDIHPDAELAPRDVVARGVFAAAQNGGAFLDCRAAIGAHFAEKFPTVYATCFAAGIDPVTMPIPVAPAAHYHMGGVKTDADGRVEGVSGLYAIGEVASTGVHGANRLASNSLLEAVVFADRAAKAIRAEGQDSPAPAPSDEGAMQQDAPSPAALHTLRATMQAKLGVVRDGAGITEAISTLKSLASEHPALQPRVEVALLIAEAALGRHESRGGHQRTDYPALMEPMMTWQNKAATSPSR